MDPRRWPRRFWSWLKVSQPWNRHQPTHECTDYRWERRASEDLDTLYRTAERRNNPAKRVDRGGMGWEDPGD